MSQPRASRPKNIWQTPQARQKWKQMQPSLTEEGNLKDRLLSWLPEGSRAFVFVVVMLTSLVIGVIHFVSTGDPSVVIALLPYAAAYVGLAGAKSLFDHWPRERPPL